MAHYDLSRIRGAIDLWGCMWSSDERRSYELSLVRAMEPLQPAGVRLDAWAAAWVVSTPLLVESCADAREAGIFPPGVLEAVEEEALPVRRAFMRAASLKGQLDAVEQLLRAVTDGSATIEERLVLVLVDVRDLVMLASTTGDRALHAAVERAVSHRGPYQRARVANRLGFRVGPQKANCRSQAQEAGERQVA